MATPAVADESTANGDEVQSLAERIDRHIAARWKTEHVTPAPPADDAEFMRRAYLHIAGKIPPVAEVREFLADTSPDKRRRLVDRLLEGPAYVTHFTTEWRKVMMPESGADFQVRFLVPGFEAWLREQLIAGTQYDEMVRELLTVPLDAGARQNMAQRLQGATPLAFYQAKQVAPENLAAATSRTFLGIRIDCAQCHDHPFDLWTREQFWSYAAFFAGIERQGDRGIFSGIRELPDRRELAIPETDMVVQAAFLQGGEPRWKPGVGARETLAEWMTARDNPYFARTAVNRMWGHFFGVGIVDPVDDFGGSNRPSHPELLDELAREFAAHNFDLKFLIRAITASRAYQLTSRKTHASQEHPQLFARMNVQAMTPEQLFDSLAQATGHHEQFQSRRVPSFRGNDPRSEILQLFANDSDAPTERTTTILQALALMNGRFVAEATSLERSATLAAIAEFPMTAEQRIETLYLATLTRKPRPEELSHMRQHLETGGPAGDPQKALGDVFWALLNSSEFLMNH